MTTAHHIKHSRVSDSDTDSESSFSSPSSTSPDLCDKHKHLITHKVHFPTLSFRGSPDNNLYKTTGFISPSKYLKVGGNHPQTDFTQYRKVNDGSDMLQLRRELSEKNRRIEELVSENRRLVGELRNQREQAGDQMEQFIYELRSSKDEGNPLVSRQNKKIELLLGEFERLKSENGERFREVKKEIQRMRSVGPLHDQGVKENKSVKRSKERVKEVVIEEERCLKWKNNFISSFLDMMEKVAAKEGVVLDKKLEPKLRVKAAWRYLKDLFKH